MSKNSFNLLCNLTRNSRCLWRTCRPVAVVLPQYKLSNCASKTIPISISGAKFYSNNIQTESESGLDAVTYDRVCTETLDALCDYFEELTENAAQNGSDVAYSDGVLTVNLGPEFGTYVINRQTPNKQIWLSSPKSGPKRFDFVGPQTAANGKWIYRHTGESLHDLLQTEIQIIFTQQKVDFTKLPYSN